MHLPVSVTRLKSRPRLIANVIINDILYDMGKVNDHREIILTQGGMGGPDLRREG